jgi:peptidoglycan hydrolase FlgJ
MAMGIHAATSNAATINAAQSASRAAAQTAGAPSPKLVRAAHEFEGMMMKELLKPMTAGEALTGDDGDGDDSGSGSALGEFAGEALGQGLSQEGGFGIANRIVAQLSHSGNALKSGKVTEKMHRNTVMGAAE